MPKYIAIAASSYIIKKGLQAIIEAFSDAQLIFPESLQKLNELLDDQPVHMAIIDTALLRDQKQADILFQLKHCPLIGMEYNIKASGHRHPRLDSLIDINMPKHQVISILQANIKQSAPENSRENHILSEREKEVLKYIALGFTHQEIADHLSLSRHTVITHRKNISARLGIKTVSGLTLYAALHKLIPGDHMP